MGNYSFIANNNVKCTWSNCVEYLGTHLFEIKQSYEFLLKVMNIEDTEKDFLNNLEKLKSKFYEYKKADAKQKKYTVEDYLKEYPPMDMKYYNN